MHLNPFVEGALLGFAIAAPVGPIGLLCIGRTLKYGRFSGFCSGLGAAVADSFYGAIAAFGLTLISDFLIDHAFWLRLLGGIFLVYLGIKMFFAKTSFTPGKTTHQSLVTDFMSTFFITLTNPLTLLSYIAIFAGLGIGNGIESFKDASWLVVGVFSGSTLWWLTLSEGITLFRKRMSQKMLLWIDRIAGLIIVSFGLAAWVSIFIPLF